MQEGAFGRHQKALGWPWARISGLEMIDHSCARAVNLRLFTSLIGCLHSRVQNEIHSRGPEDLPCLCQSLLSEGRVFCF